MHLHQKSPHAMNKEGAVCVCVCVWEGEEGKKGRETDMTCCLLDVGLLFFTVGYRVTVFTIFILCCC